MQGPPFRVLFVSQRNSARSMMAEAIANSIGHGEFEAYSAGVRPAAHIDPMAVELLKHAGIDGAGPSAAARARIQRAGFAAARLRLHAE